MPVLDHSSELFIIAEKEKFLKHFVPRLQCPVASVFVTVVETETKHIRGPLT